MSDTRVTVVTTEVLYAPTPETAVTSLATEVLYAPVAQTAVTALTTEVLYTSRTHLYWRVRFLTGNGSALLAVSELQMRATPGGADQCTGGTASASSVYSTFTADEAFDDDTSSSSFWASNFEVAGAWLRYQFATPVEVQEIAIIERDTEPTQAPRSGVVEWSDDGLAWTTAWTWETYTWRGQSEGRVFTHPEYVSIPTTTHWRMVTLTNGGSAATSLVELEMRSSLGGTDQCSGGTASTNDDYGGAFPATNAFDNSLTTLWAGNGAAGLWLRYVFASALRVVEIAITERDTEVTQAPRSGVVEYSTDSGATWGTAFTWSTGAWSAVNEQRVFSDPTASSPEVQIALYQGTTLITSRVADGLTSTVAPFTFALTGPELAAITSPASLTVVFTHANGGVVRVTAASLVLEGEAAGVTYDKAVAASVTTATQVLRAAARVLSSSLTSSAAVWRQSVRVLSAASTASTSLVQQARRSLEATTAGSGALRQESVRSISAAVTASALLLRSVPRGISAGVALSALLVMRGSRALSGAITAVTSLAGVKSFQRVVTAAISLTAQVEALNVFQRAVSAAVTGATQIWQQAQVRRTAMLTGATYLVHQGYVRVAGAVSSSTSQVQRLQRTLTATVAAGASLTAALTLLRTVVASLTASTVTGAAIALRRTFEASLTAGAVIVPVKLLARTVSAVLTLSSAVQQRVTAGLAASVVGGAAVRRYTQRQAQRAVAMATTIQRRPARETAGVVLAGATVAAERASLVVLTVALMVSSGIRTRMAVLRDASMALGAGLWRYVVIRVTAISSMGAGLFRRTPQSVEAEVSGGVALASQKTAQQSAEAALAVTATLQRLPQVVQRAVVALLGVLDLVNEWSGLIRATATVSQRYEGTLSLVIPPATSQLRQQAATAQTQLLPGAAQVQPLPSTGQATPLPGTGTLQS